MRARRPGVDVEGELAMGDERLRFGCVIVGVSVRRRDALERGGCGGEHGRTFYCVIFVLN